MTGASLAEPIRFRIDYTPYIIGNLDSVVEVSYHVNRAAGGTASSAIEPMVIRNPVAAHYPPPTVREAANNGTGMLASDTIAVLWSGPSPAGTIVTDQKDGSPFGFVDFSIAAAVLAACLDGPVSITYAVVREGAEPVLSDTLAFQVLALPDASLADSRPTIDEQQDAVLDLNTFAGAATVRVAPWPLIAQGQRVWLTAQSNLLKRVPLNGEALTAAQVSAGLVQTLDRNYLEQLADGARLTLTCKVWTAPPIPPSRCSIPRSTRCQI